MSKYEKPTKKLCYLNDNSYLKDGATFTDKLEYNIDASTLVNGNVNLIMEIDEVNENNLIGYEIYRDNKVIGFTYSDRFVDKTASPGTNHKYSIVAYDLKLNAKGESIDTLYSPVISVAEDATIKIHSKLDPYKYVVAKNYKGEDLSSKVEIIFNNVDTSKKGNYTIEYKIEDNNYIKTGKTNIEVVSDIDYLSDISESSAKVGWGKLEKDLAPNQSKIGLQRQNIAVPFEKGIGAHANSEIVFNVEGNNYTAFKSTLGIDDHERGNSNSSAKYIIEVDGNKVYESKIFKENTDLEEISVLLPEGAKEVKLITNQVNENTWGDHTCWADAIFIQ